MVELVDIYPTLADLSGLRVPDYLQGVSLRPLLGHPERLGKKKFAYSVVSRVKSSVLPFATNVGDIGKWPDGEELYNLTNDPQEKAKSGRKGTRLGTPNGIPANLGSASTIYPSRNASLKSHRGINHSSAALSL